jgi:hypothetical protein
VRNSSFAIMKKLLFLGACLMALASQPVMAQTTGPDLVVVRVLEMGRKLQFSIAHGQQQPEEVTFDLSKEVRAAPSYYTALAKFYSQGYVVQAVIPGMTNGSGYIESTLILAKPTSKP